MALVEFYGRECPFCNNMAPRVRRLREEEGINITQYEIWYHAKNRKKLESLDCDGACDGVPFFFNTVTGTSLCGEVSYARLKAWAKKRRNPARRRT